METTLEVPISAEREAEYVELDGAIVAGLRTIGETFAETGERLARMRDGEVYLARYTGFEEYCRERLGMSKSRAYQFIAIAGVMRNLCASTIVDGPSSEFQARPLSRLEPEQQVQAWTLAVEASGGKPTAEQVKEAAEAVAPRATGRGAKAADREARAAARRAKADAKAKAKAEAKAERERAKAEAKAERRRARDRARGRADAAVTAEQAWANVFHEHAILVGSIHLLGGVRALVRTWSPASIERAIGNCAFITEKFTEYEADLKEALACASSR